MGNHPFLIRPANSDDIPRIVELENFMRRPSLTLEDYLKQESERHADYPYVRFVAEQDGEVIGVAGGGKQNWLKPNYMWVAINVEPSHRGRGVGRALYEALQPFYLEHQPEFVRTSVVDDHHTTLQWGERLGFRAVEVAINSKLDVRAFDREPYSGLLQRVESEGIRLVSFESLRSPENEQRLYDLFAQTVRDIPGQENRPTMPFERFRVRFFEEPTAWLEAIIVAIDADDQWLGFTNIWSSTTDPKLADLGITGVRREFRGRGLAQALKVVALDVLKKHGIDTITTGNDSNNEPILRINRKMGYVKEEGLVTLELAKGQRS